MHGGVSRYHTFLSDASGDGRRVHCRDSLRGMQRPIAPFSWSRRMQSAMRMRRCLLRAAGMRRVRRAGLRNGLSVLRSGPAPAFVRARENDASAFVRTCVSDEPDQTRRMLAPFLRTIRLRRADRATTPAAVPPRANARGVCGRPGTGADAVMRLDAWLGQCPSGPVTVTWDVAPGTLVVGCRRNNC